MQKEINKYLKLINAEKLKKNHRTCIELYNIVGGLCTEIGSYDEAYHYHEEAFKICKTIGDRSLTTVTSRFMGEAQAALGNYDEAIEHIKRYQDLAEKLEDKVEIQRAWTTMGRVLLMQAQDLKDKNTIVDKQTRKIAREAEKRFQTAMTLAESVREQVDEKEYAQMISGLYTNMALIKDICGQHQEAVAKFNRAIETCRAARIKDELFRSQILLASIHRQSNDIKQAIRLSEGALETARSIGKKIYICEALIERGLTRLCQRDFKNAKRTFAQAYLEKSPNEEDHSKAIRLTKLSHLILDNYEKITSRQTAGEQRLKSCDKLGDLFVAVGNFRLAIEFYRRAYSDAKVLQKPKSDLAKILFSIAETYADDLQFQQALLCYEKELTFRIGNSKEQCQSLIKIAHMNEYLERDAEKVSECYEKALDSADKDPKLMHQVLRYYVPYLKKNAYNPSRCRELEDTLLNLKSYPEVIEAIELEDQEEACEDPEDEVADVDDVITDDESNDQVIMIGRRKASGSKFKQNEVGDTPLHEAAIKGDLKRVKSLVAQGHDINPRDNAGWIPLHEACNHGHFQVAEFLIECGADVNNRGMKGLSPLHDAATNGHYDIMRLLMGNGANVIALTDSGETVLSCLRDYKRRNSGSFSNQESIEYRQIEAELLNTMDKCGFSLMNENTKSSSNVSASAAKVDAPSKVQRGVSRFELDPGRASSSAAQDYRHTIQNLKRKRNPEACASSPVHKKSQPATVIGGNGSISTKQWLAADDFEEYDDDDNEEVGVISGFNELDERETNKNQREPERIVGRQSKTNSKQRHDEPIVLDDWDDGLDDDIEFINNTSPSDQARREKPTEEVLLRNEEISSPRCLSSSRESLSSVIAANIRGSHKTTIDKDNPRMVLNVSIEERLLIVPIAAETTVGELKQSIIDRYCVLVQVRPTIRLAIKGQPSAYFFDQDLCKDVIHTCDLVAVVEDWNLKSMESVYCDEVGSNPLSSLRLEFRTMDETKLNWAHVRMPQSHLKPALLALSRRPFERANFQGSTQFFEKPMIAQELLLKSCILTWRQLTSLSLKCTGMMRSHFELLCAGGGCALAQAVEPRGDFEAAQASALTPAAAAVDARNNTDKHLKAKLPELLWLDVSVNSIAYKSQQEFVVQLKRLRQAVCPKLKRLDVRRNHLQFAKRNSSSEAARSLESELAQLGEGDIEIVLSEQSEGTIYSATSKAVT